MFHLARMSLTHPTAKAEALIEALPYLQAFRGKTVLVKLGGAAMEDPELVAKVMRDIVFLEVAGINPIVVHGGGKAISAAMAAAGQEATFVGGYRVTSDEAISIVENVLTEEINPALVRMIRDFGGKAVGIPGTDVFLGEKMKVIDKEGNRVDIGAVFRTPSIADRFGRPLGKNPHLQFSAVAGDRPPHRLHRPQSRRADGRRSF